MIFNQKITIVTVTYNAEAYLEQTIINILEQDYPNIEYIIIDGASTDSTIDIIKKYEKEIDYWISEPDKGIYDAMNKAIDIATGEWINFMNAGDTFVDSSTIKIALSQCNEKTELLYGDSFLINKKKKQYRKAKEINNFFSGIPLCHQSLFAKTKILKTYKFDTFYSIAGDYDFILKTFTKKYNYQYIDTPICNFLDEGISKKEIIKSSIEALMVISKYSNELVDIYNLNPFKILLNSDTEHLNYYFSDLFNRFKSEIIRLKLDKEPFILYGFGNIGKMIHLEFQDTIQMIVDINSHKTSKKIKKNEVYSPSNLINIQYDKILISVLGREKEIIQYLTEELNIDLKKIITLKV